MPNYEYKCEKCAQEIEVKWAKVNDPPPGCIACQIPMERQVSLGIFRMIGGGWNRSNHNRWSHFGPKSFT